MLAASTTFVPPLLFEVVVQEPLPLLLYLLGRHPSAHASSGSLLEIQPAYGASLITALAFLGGRAVAILANDPSVRAGAVDSAAAIKGPRRS